MSLMRIDKLLAQSGFGSRKEVKAILKKGLVNIDGEIIKTPETKIDPKQALIYVGNELIQYEKFIYLMMNKPEGIISATTDNNETTVIDLLDDQYYQYDLFPVGRLDKDTVGLIILTNDGIFAHRATSPKKRVDKVYYAKIKGSIGKDEIKKFSIGIVLDDGYICKPADLTILNDLELGGTEKGYEIRLVIQEGKFHQVKRMFDAVGCEVVFLKRVEFAGIALDESLNPGEVRRLNDIEMNKIIKLISRDE
ncbi:MAG: rRNA pseudouridine synthase [Defluviitaleaceae bacterium]|nr:rRNA pseudouridine synthase [Defluviitaleaceae bacterium]